MFQPRVFRSADKRILHKSGPKKVWESLGPGVEVFRYPTGEPVRRIITQGGSRKVGGFYSWKMMNHTVFESVTEERCSMLMDVHSAVDAFYAQPETIRVTGTEGNSFEYTPDFLSILGGTRFRLENKRACDLWPPKPADRYDESGIRKWEKAALVRARLRAVRQAYTRCGLQWKLVLDLHIANMAAPEVVDELVSHGGRPISEGDWRRLREHIIAAENATTLDAASAVLREAEDPRGTVLARVSEGLLGIDLHEIPRDESLVFLTGRRRDEV